MMDANKKIKLLVLIILISGIVIAGSFAIFSMKILGSEPVRVVPTEGNEINKWDEENKEIILNKCVINEDNKSYDNVMVIIEFYKDENFEELMKTKKLYNLKMKDGFVCFNYTTKLPEEPKLVTFSVMV